MCYLTDHLLCYGSSRQEEEGPQGNEEAGYKVAYTPVCEAASHQALLVQRSDIRHVQVYGVRRHLRTDQRGEGLLPSLVAPPRKARIQGPVHRAADQTRDSAPRTRGATSHRHRTP